METVTENCSFTIYIHRLPDSLYKIIPYYNIKHIQHNISSQFAFDMNIP